MTQNIDINSMTEQQKETYMWETLKARVQELLKHPEFYAEYQSKASEQEAKQWAMQQALWTLLYSPEEREEMLKRKNNQN